MKDKVGQIENAIFIGVNEFELEEEEDLVDAERILDRMQNRPKDLSKVFDLITQDKKIARHDQ